MEQIGCLKHNSVAHCKKQKRKGHSEESTSLPQKRASYSVEFFHSVSSDLSSESLFCCESRQVSTEQTSRLWSNVATPDPSDQKILYGQDKHMPFIIEVASSVKATLWYGWVELRTENVKPSSHWKERETLWITGFYIYIFFFFLKKTKQDKQTTAVNLLVLLNVLSGLL